MLSSPKPVYGISSVTPYNLTTKERYGIIRVLQGSELTTERSKVQLFGGSSIYPWASENDSEKVQIKLKLNEYPSFLFELAQGKAPTENAAEATGAVYDFENAKGTSIKNATTGIASLAAIPGSEANLKYDSYVIKYASATTINIFGSSHIDHGRGVAATFQNDLLKLNAAPITVPNTGGTVDFTDIGLRITGGSGTVAFTSGDTAYFSIRPINTSSRIVTIGSLTQVFPYFGLICYAQKSSSGRMTKINAFKCSASGLPLNFSRANFSESELVIDLVYDTTKDGLYTLEDIET